MQVDLESELRRAERYSDLSRSAFVIGAIAFSVVACFAAFVFWTGIIYRG